MEQGGNVPQVEPNGLFMRGVPCGIRNIGNTCSLNVLLQIISASERLMQWVRENPSAEMVIRNASNRDIFAWRIVRALEDMDAMVACRLVNQDERKINMYSARFSLPSCRNKEPNVKSWTDNIDQSSYGIVNQVCKGTFVPAELVRSTKKEPWTDCIKTDERFGQKPERALYAMLYSMRQLQQNDVTRDVRLKTKPHMKDFFKLVYGRTLYDKRCTNPQCNTKSDRSKTWPLFEVNVQDSVGLRESIQMGFDNWHDGHGEPCHDCFNGQQSILCQTHFIPPVLVFFLNYKNAEKDQNGQLVASLGIWEELNQSLFVCGETDSQGNDDSERNWQMYRLRGVGAVSESNNEFEEIMKPESIDLGGRVGYHEVAYVNMYMEARGETWFRCDGEQITMIKPEELAIHAMSGDPKKIGQEYPEILIYEIADSPIGMHGKNKNNRNIDRKTNANYNSGV